MHRHFISCHALFQMDVIGNLYCKIKTFLKYWRYATLKSLKSQCSLLWTSFTTNHFCLLLIDISNFLGSNINQIPFSSQECSSSETTLEQESYFLLLLHLSLLCRSPVWFNAESHCVSLWGDSRKTRGEGEWGFRFLGKAWNNWGTLKYNKSFNGR